MNCDSVSTVSATNARAVPTNCWPVMSQSQEQSYVEALKSHQKSRLDHMCSETNRLKQFLETLRKEVMTLESSQSEHSIDGNNWSAKVSTLRHQNRSLRIDCHCLSMEVDLYASGQMPLGITDENFYKNIPPGPHGPLFGPFARPTAHSAIRGHHELMSRSPHPPSYEESMIFPPPRFAILNHTSNADLLRQVPPAPRPVWLSPQVQQPVQSPQPHSGQSPPLIPPRPISISGRTPPCGPVGVPTGLSCDQLEGQKWVCEKCTVENHPALAYCELCEMPRNANYIGINHIESCAHSSGHQCYCHSFDH